MDVVFLLYDGFMEQENLFYMGFEWLLASEVGEVFFSFMLLVSPPLYTLYLMRNLWRSAYHKKRRNIKVEYFFIF